MATVLECVQAVCREIGVYAPSALVSSTEETGRQMKELCHETADEIRNEYPWAELSREHTFSLVSGTAAYALPADFNRWAFDTAWNRSETMPLSGPFSPERWQEIKSGGISTATIQQRFRVKGISGTQLYIDPTPGATENGQTVAFEYFSTNTFRPRTWTASLTFLAGTYCFYNGNYYYSSAGGVTGATPPTHTTGSASDGGVSWAFNSDKYETILADTDVPVLDERLFKMGIKWRFLRAKGLAFQDHEMAYREFMKKRVPAKRGAERLPLSNRRLTRNPNMPDTITGV